LKVLFGMKGKSDKKSLVEKNEVFTPRSLLDQKTETLTSKGTCFLEPQNVIIRGQLTCGENVEIDANVIFEGNVHLQKNVKIGANCILRDATIGQNTVINPFSLIEEASVGSDSFVGPYGRVRPNSEIGNNVQIGNFVEIKNANISDGTRINHLSFIGDAELKDNVTIGAGTITCNHDGADVNRTIVEEGAYIGTNVSLVAPLKIAKGSMIGSGSTITEDTPAQKLTIARARQVVVGLWKGPKNKRDKKT
jgi:bifunctional UDP-N-acetylglucosamine pyrophosphorylase/glucosamine-1-phosphate N-acetyltransferase